MAAASDNAIVEECSSLEAILGSELLICQTDPLLQIVVQVTADLLSVDLCLRLDEERIDLYPEQAIPLITVRSSSPNISPSNISSIEDFLRKLADQLLGQPMMFQLIESCREQLYLITCDEEQKPDIINQDSETQQCNLERSVHEIDIKQGEIIKENDTCDELLTVQTKHTCDSIQARELEVVSSVYKSFKLLQLTPERSFEVTLAATPHVLTNKIAVCLCLTMPPDYPYDSLQVKVSIVKGKKKSWQRVALQRYLVKLADRARGRTCTGELLKSAKSWLQHRNSALLVEEGLGHYAWQPRKGTQTLKVITQCLSICVCKSHLVL